jgi:hypothetical protein
MGSTSDMGSTADMIDDSTPSWAQGLATSMAAMLSGQNELRNDVSEINRSLQALQLDMSKQGTQIVELDSRVEINQDRIERLENLVGDLKDENERLGKELVDLRDDVEHQKGVVDEQKGVLNEQIDRAMRDQLMFFGVEKAPNEKHWDYEHTTRHLAAWLGTASGKPAKYFDKAIIRAHRGPVNPEKSGPPVIHCAFRWRVSEEVRQLFMSNNHAISGVSIKNKCSDATKIRVDNALKYRKNLRAGEGGKELKMKVDYPARLMVKAPGETKYTLKKAF